MMKDVHSKTIINMYIMFLYVHSAHLSTVRAKEQIHCTVLRIVQFRSVTNMLSTIAEGHISSTEVTSYTKNSFIFSTCCSGLVHLMSFQLFRSSCHFSSGGDWDMPAIQVEKPVTVKVKSFQSKEALRDYARA